MKTNLFGLVFLGLTNLVFAQNEIATVSYAPVNYTTTAKTIATSNTFKNVDYLTSINFENSAKHIKLLHEKVANYNIKEAKVYVPKSLSSYDVVFTEGANQITAVYNHLGDIINSYESYKNVKLPYAITYKVAEDYPGWEFNSTWCNVTYSKYGVSKTHYKIELKKGNEKKIVRIAE